MYVKMNKTAIEEMKKKPKVKDRLSEDLEDNTLHSCHVSSRHKSVDKNSTLVLCCWVVPPETCISLIPVCAYQLMSDHSFNDAMTGAWFSCLYLAFRTEREKVSVVGPPICL